MSDEAPPPASPSQTSPPLTPLPPPPPPPPPPPAQQSDDDGDGGGDGEDGGEDVAVPAPEASTAAADRENASPIKSYIQQTPEQISTIQFENEISPVATNGNLNRPCAWQSKTPVTFAKNR